MSGSNAASERGIAIIGAGLTGLTAGDRLRRAGHAVTLFDKGRAPGGRIATRTRPAGIFNHGAPSLDGDSAAFARFRDGLPRADALRDRLRPIIEPLRIETGVEIAEITEGEEGWFLTDLDAAAHGPFDMVVLTVPAPQAARLLSRMGLGLSDLGATVAMAPVWTAMAVFEDPLPLEHDVAHRDVYRAVRQPDPARNAWVIHMGRDWTEAHLERDKATFGPAILDAFACTFDLTLPGVSHLAAHRWRYAFAARPLGAPHLGHAGRGLLIGGDWCLGPLAEHAWQSGMSIADAIISG